MCGINGIIGHASELESTRLVGLMNAAMAHRGPDSEGCWAAPGIAIGHRRLSILDTSDAGRQPFFSEDRTLVLAFNGEVYNYVELRNELAPHYRFATGTDTEVIIAAYRQWGIECIHRFIGMFAFVLWDAKAGKGFLVRDRLGIKPLYTAEVDGSMLFASEVRSLLATGCVSRELDADGLTDYLRYQTVHAPRTILRQVSMLPAGHLIEFDAAHRRIIRYWDMADRACTDVHAELPKVHSRISDLLHSAVELRMRADVPFGAFLSGGIDSSIIVGLMAGVSSNPVDTFSVTFDEKEWDESSYSSLIAARFNTRHHPIPLRAADFLHDLPAALEAMDHPSGDGPNTFVVSRVTRREGVKMALSGLGGDELFAGYPVFKQMKRLESQRWIGHTPTALRALAGKALLAVKPSVASEKINALLQAESFDFIHSYPLSRRVLLDNRIRELLSAFPASPDMLAQIAASVEASPLPLLSKVSVAEMKGYMQNVLLRDADQMSMAHALEVRVPFLDHRLVEFVLGVPDAMKYPHSPKKLLTDAVGQWIPREIIDRPKMGFTFPWALWMRNEMRADCEENLQYLGRLPYFREGAVMAAWQDFLRGHPSMTWSRLWPLVVLGHWTRIHRIV